MNISLFAQKQWYYARNRYMYYLPNWSYVFGFSNNPEWHWINLVETDSDIYNEYWKNRWVKVMVAEPVCPREPFQLRLI